MKKLNLLYLSCHSVLSVDECSLLTEIGHYCFCPNSFVEKLNPGDPSIRPQIEVLPENLERYRSDMEAFHKLGKPGIDNKELLTKDFVDRFDAVIVMHMPKWIHANWEVMKHKHVILREIGQSVASNEAELRPYREQGMKIIRYSPREKVIPGYNGSDALIRFYKDPNEFCGWTGEKAEVISFAQSMERRGPACNFKWFEEATRKFPRKLYGSESESLSWGKGKVSFDELKAAMREHRVYVNGGTFPASYTLGLVEALMTGTPVVSVGPAMGHPFPWFGYNHPLYEVGDFIKTGVNGCCSDSMKESQDFIRQCLEDHDFARKIGEAGRATAIELFGKEKIKAEWTAFLDSL